MSDIHFLLDSLTHRTEVRVPAISDLQGVLRATGSFLVAIGYMPHQVEAAIEAGIAAIEPSPIAAGDVMLGNSPCDRCPVHHPRDTCGMKLPI